MSHGTRLQVYRVPIGGMLVKQPIALGGSGSTYLFGYADANFKPKMTKEECLQFTANGELVLVDTIQRYVVIEYNFVLQPWRWL